MTRQGLKLILQLCVLCSGDYGRVVVCIAFGACLGTIGRRSRRGSGHATLVKSCVRRKSEFCGWSIASGYDVSVAYSGERLEVVTFFCVVGVRVAGTFRVCAGFANDTSFDGANGLSGDASIFFVIRRLIM